MTDEYILWIVRALQRTLLQLEYEQCKHIMRVLETRESEIGLVMHNLKGADTVDTVHVKMW